jgi:hypothetical protein
MPLAYTFDLEEHPDPIKMPLTFDNEDIRKYIAGNDQIDKAAILRFGTGGETHYSIRRRSDGLFQVCMMTLSRDQPTLRVPR